jgi:hypothetical protein
MQHQQKLDLNTKQETLADRAQVYWETLKHGDTIDAEQLFDVSKQRKDLNQDIKHIRSFLTRKFNDGFAFLIPGQSPPTYRKLEKRPNIAQFCTMTFNSLPMDQEITLVSFRNRLPLKYQKGKGVQSFLHRAKICGALVNMLDDHGSIITEGKYVRACKKAAILKLPSMGKIKNQPTRQNTLKSKTVETPSKKDMAFKIFDMTAGEAGIAIFQTLYKLMEENENQQETINSLNAGLEDMLRKNKDLHISNKKLEETILEYKKKDKTFAELLHGQKG